MQPAAFITHVISYRCCSKAELAFLLIVSMVKCVSEQERCMLLRLLGITQAKLAFCVCVCRVWGTDKLI
jgi:hypothetical protein